MVAQDFDFETQFPGLGDSKILSPKTRTTLCARATAAVARGELAYALAYEDAGVVDALGITVAVQKALDRCISMLAPLKGATHIYLDGLLHAPDTYSQKTVVHGDALVPAISLASVIAKVSRDALMNDLSVTYPQYGFDRHKGYGTRAHYAALALHGPSPIHRLSFL